MLSLRWSAMRSGGGVGVKLCAGVDDDTNDFLLGGSVYGELGIGGDVKGGVYSMKRGGSVTPSANAMFFVGADVPLKSDLKPSDVGVEYGAGAHAGVGVEFSYYGAPIRGLVEGVQALEDIMFMNAAIETDTYCDYYDDPFNCD